MLKFVWMSDLHFTCDGDVLGHDPRIRLDAAIAHINTHHQDAAFCIITGDLVNRGTPADYAALASRLGGLTLPVYPMVGNHDDRALMKQHLPLPDTCMHDFVQYPLDTPGALIVALDTQKTGSDAGEFCAARQDWLGDVLNRNGTKPVLVFMHHHPMPLGLPMQDTENLQNGSRFLDFLAAYESVNFLGIGHVHRPITGSVRGIPFATMRSVLYQAPAPQPAWDWNSFKPGSEAPDLGIVTVSGADVTVQYHQFCPFETGTPG